MEEKTSLTKTMVIVGLLLVWLPILIALLRYVLTDPTAETASLGLLDYLRPVLGPIGGGVLFWAALRLRSRMKFIGLGMIVMLGSLVASQLFARFMGISAGEPWPIGPAWIIFMFLLEVSFLSLIVVAFGGALLLRDLSRAPVVNEELE